MNRYPTVLLFLLALLASCGNDESQHKDSELNNFSADYKRIYREYYTLPLDSTRLRLEAFLKEFPNDAKSWVFLGRVYYDMNDSVKAEASYRQSIEHNPRFFEAYSSLGSLFFLQGKNDSVLKYFEQSLEMKDSTTYTRVNLAWLYKQLGQDDKSMAMLQEVEARNDSLPPVLLRVAHLQWLMSNGEAANAAVSKAVVRGFDDTVGWNAVLNGHESFENFCRRNHL